MRCPYHLAMAFQSEEEWEPALGTYGWLWITLAGTAGFVGYKFVRRRMDQTEALRRHEEIWGQRPDETEDQTARRSRRSAYNSRGDFDPPGGWGAMGPDNG